MLKDEIESKIEKQGQDKMLKWEIESQIKHQKRTVEENPDECFIFDEEGYVNLFTCLMPLPEKGNLYKRENRIILIEDHNPDDGILYYDYISKDNFRAVLMNDKIKALYKEYADKFKEIMKYGIDG